jgi:outer membrane murein-binding lipoprotein Lpp
MKIDVTIRNHPDLRDYMEAWMSELSNKIAELDGKVDAATARISSDVAGLYAKIAELQALVDAGNATPADIAALAALEAKVDAIDPVP